MTNLELNAISEEIDDISQQVSKLDPDNSIENTLREHLFHRWDFLDFTLNQALMTAKKNNLTLITN